MDWPWLVARVLPWALLGVYVVNEVNGVVRKMLPTYSGGETGLSALTRLAQLQPDWPVATVALWGGITALAMLVIAVGTCAKALKKESNLPRVT